MTAARLREVLEYDRATGLFTHKVARSGVTAGSVAGSMSGGGYLYITVDGVKYGAHRLALLYVTGELQAEDIDHRNGLRADNRYANLRRAGRAINNQNRRFLRSDNTSGFTGVSQTPSGKWRARVSLQGRERHLGRFSTPEQAHAVALDARRALYPGCTL